MLCMPSQCLESPSSICAKAFQSRKTMVCCGMGDLLKSWCPRPTSVAWRSLRSHTPILHWIQPQTSHLVLITQSCQEPSSQSKPQPHGETTILTMRPHQVRCLCPRADEKTDYCGVEEDNVRLTCGSCLCPEWPELLMLRWKEHCKIPGLLSSGWDKTKGKDELMGDCYNPGHMILS